MNAFYNNLKTAFLLALLSGLILAVGSLFGQQGLIVALVMWWLGMPSPQALAALCRQLEAINEHLARIEAAQPKRAPRRRPPRA